MNKKRLISVLIVVLLLTSLLTVAQTDNEKSSCSGFWGSISCFFWGNPENRAGRVITPPPVVWIGPGFSFTTEQDGTSRTITGDTWKDFEKLDVYYQTEYIKALTDPEQEYVLLYIEPMRRKIINDALELDDPSEFVDYWNKVKDSINKGHLTIPPADQMWVALTAADIQSLPPLPTPPPPPNTPIAGTPYYLTPDGNFVDVKGKAAPSMDILLNPQHPIITHDQAYTMLDARAQQSESRVLQGLPDGTQVNYQGNTYQYKDGKWQTADKKPAPAGLSSAVVQGQAQVTQPTILAGLPSNNFKIGDQQYTYGPDNQWHTGGAGGTIISAADLEKKLLASGTSGSGAPSYLPPGVTGNDELQQRITALKSQKDQIEKAKKARQEADSQMWAGSWFEGIQTSRGYQNIKQYASTAGDIASVMASGGKYQALSNALFGRETSRTWFLNADSEFFTTWANLPSYAATHGPLAPEACELDDARRTEIPGSSSQFVQTAGGSYQFVGAIQAEKTATTQPILCKRNEDPEMEAEFACRTGQVCVEDEFCHADADSDKEPDSEQPAQGYFYKITWGVAAPFDESFTPYIDEDNKAVKFNIQLIAEDGTSIWLYNRAGITGTGVIALENGASDRDVKTHFSSRVFDKACIRYDPQYTIKDRDGTEVEDQCVDIIVRNSGSVEFGSSRRTQSVTTASSEVSSNTDW